MIDIYLPGNEKFDVNGDMTLTPTVCDLDQTINDTWAVEMEHPIDELGRWTYIVENAVIRGNAPNGKQLYRINKVRVSDSGVYATARPIFMDAKNDCFLVDVRPKKVNGQDALNAILASNNKYSAESNITRKTTAYYILKNAIEAIMGDDNSFITRWGGEIVYDNFKIIINKQIGSSKGFELLYGKNILDDGLKETVNMEDVITRIVPTSYNGYRLSGNSPWVDSPYINDYPTIRTKVINYPHIRLKEDVNENEDDDSIIVCDTLDQLRTELRNAAAADFSENEIDRPSVTINVHIALLQNKEEYKHIKSIDSSLSLGDTVYCRHSKLGIVSTARITQMTWDLIKGGPKSVTIGKTERSFIQRIVSSLSLATSKAEVAESTIQELESKLDSLKVGGTNILRGTDKLLLNSSRGQWKYGGWYRSPATNNTSLCENITLTDSPVSGVTNGVRVRQSDVSAQVGIAQSDIPFVSEKATISVWVKGSAGVIVYVGTHSGHGKAFNLENNDWTRLVYTSTEQVVAGVGGVVYLIPNNYSEVKELLICAPKMEYGNRATDWSASPFDNTDLGQGRNLLLKSDERVESTSYLLNSWNFGDIKPIEDEVYTLQIKGRLGTDKQAFIVYNTNDNTAEYVLGGGYRNNNASTVQWITDDCYDEQTGIYTAKIVWRVGTSENTSLRLYAYPNETTTDPTIIEWIKLEKGTTPTGWSPAPEDVEDEFNSLTNYINGELSTIQSQVDGKIETFYQTTDPSTSWTATQKAEHEGDIWQNSSTGKTYRWNGSAWQEMTTTPPSVIMDTIDGKAQVFVNQPTPPYSVGDLWFNSTTSDIMTCITSRTTGSYTTSDWQKRNKYTDDTALNTFISGTYSTDKTNLQNQIDGKAETWYQSTDPSSSWTTAALKAQHEGDLWYNTTNNTTWFYNGTTWQQQNVPTEVFDEIDGKAQIFISTPTVPYHKGDLWFNSTTSDIMTCITSRTTGSYTTSDWQKRNKYTDDTAVENLAIGGRNYLRRIDPGHNDSVVQRVTVDYDPKTGIYVLKPTQTGTSFAQVYSYDAVSPDLVPELAGKEVTFSIKEYSTTRVEASPRPYLYYYRTSTSNWAYALLTQEQKVKTLTLPDDVTRIGLILRCDQEKADTTSDVVTFFGVKLELGNKATDWTPAPEDLEDAIAKSAKSADVEYYKSTSPTTLTGGAWSTTSPLWEEGKYIWTRTKWTQNDGTITYSAASCITGNTGAAGSTGTAGKGIASVTELYYCTNTTTVPSPPTATVTTNSATTYNAWNKQPATWTSTNKYYFTCTEIKYSDNTYGWSTVVSNNAYSTANTTANAANTTANQANATANTANTTANQANTTANQAKTTADAAQTKVQELESYFWHDAAGAHVSDTPNSTAGKNVLIDSNSVDIKNGSTTLATFGEQTLIGSENARMELKFNSLTLKDNAGSDYFKVEDIRGDSGSADIRESFVATGDEMDDVFYLSFYATNISYKVYVNGVEKTSGVSRQRDRFYITPNPAQGDDITVEYTTTSNLAKAFTFGNRLSNSKRGAMSSAFGVDTVASGIYSFAAGKGAVAAGWYSHAEGWDTVVGEHTSCSHAQNRGTIANSDDQTALGRYNVEDSLRKYAVIIGNGLNNNNRSNALTVDWKGNVTANNLVTKLNLTYTTAAVVGQTGSNPLVIRANGTHGLHGAVFSKAEKSLQFYDYDNSQAVFSLYPILTKTVTGTTNASGNLNLSLNGANYTVLSVIPSNGKWAIPFIYTGANGALACWAKILTDAATFSPVASSSETVTVYYQQI